MPHVSELADQFKSLAVRISMLNVSYRYNHFLKIKYQLFCQTFVICSQYWNQTLCTADGKPPGSFIVLVWANGSFMNSTFAEIMTNLSKSILLARSSLIMPRVQSKCTTIILPDRLGVIGITAAGNAHELLCFGEDGWSTRTACCTFEETLLCFL